MTAMNSLIVNEVLRVHGPDAKRLGLDRLDEDALILGFARWAEGRLRKWLDYAKGALLFVMVPERQVRIAGTRELVSPRRGLPGRAAFIDPAAHGSGAVYGRDSPPLASAPWN